MACRWTPTQARSAGYPSSRFCFCDEGRSSREAALFGYFLALLPKSNSPVGENPRLHQRKAERRVMRFQERCGTRSFAALRMTEKESGPMQRLHTPTKLPPLLARPLI